MKEVLQPEQALDRVLKARNDGYVNWISFLIAAEKCKAKSDQWAEQFGTQHLASKKQDLRQRGLPTALATSTSVLGQPATRELILMATEFALATHPSSVWAKEQWRQRLPECGPYVMVREPRTRGDYAWTWRLQDRVFRQLSTRLTSLVKSKNAYGVRQESEIWMKVYAMKRGVRRQFRTMFRSGQKLWNACHSSPWPGLDPDNLPCSIGFRRHD